MLGIEYLQIYDHWWTQQVLLGSSSHMVTQRTLNDVNNKSIKETCKRDLQWRAGLPMNGRHE